MTLTLETAARETFDGCAAFYDALTAHHDYEDVARMVEELLDRHGHPGRRMLDVACGTGKSFVPLIRRGYEVTACDISPAMLEHARAKAGAGARLVVADMRDLPGLGQFDFVTCIDEPLNYLLEPEEVARAFRSLARNLRDGGILLFDVNTLAAFRTIFAQDDCYEQEGWLFVWRGHGDGATDAGGRSGFTIEAFVEASTGCWRRLTNQHLQRHYPAPDLVELLDGARLDLAGVYGVRPDGSLDPEPDEARHLKHFYVARKRTRGA